MKTLISFAKLAWQHAFAIDLPAGKPCPGNAFLEAWVDQVAPGRWNNKAGWYWILTDAPVVVLRTQSNTTRCTKALDIGAAVELNERTLPAEMLCQPAEDGLRVVYNGTQGRVFSRLRDHTATTEKGPYSVGLNYYPDLVAQHRWSMKIFHIGLIKQLPGLDADERRVFTELGTKHARSRVALEVAWRMTYGWPLLNRGGLEGRK